MALVSCQAAAAVPDIKARDRAMEKGHGSAMEQSEDVRPWQWFHTVVCMNEKAWGI